MKRFFLSLVVMTASMMISIPSSVTGANLTTVGTFNETNQVERPSGGLVVDSDGNVYGAIITDNGEQVGGFVFKVDADTNHLTKLITFDGTNGFYPLVGAVVAGNLYGATNGGSGTLFQISTTTNQFTTLYEFKSDGTEGLGPVDLVADSSGTLYGSTGLAQWPQKGGGSLFRFNTGTQTLHTIVNFWGSVGDYPLPGLTLDSSGNIFGVANAFFPFGRHQVFEYSPSSDQLTVAYAVQSYPDFMSNGGVVVDSSGNVFGTTPMGTGANFKGSIYKISADTHELTTLYSFSGLDGDSPWAGLIADAEGNLYGTTRFGGANGWGTVFKLSIDSNQLYTLHSFTGGSDGMQPDTRLVADAAGNLFGITPNVTILEFPSNAYNVPGTVFKLTDTGFVVPEINSIALLGIAAIGLIAFRVYAVSRRVHQGPLRTRI